MSGEVVVLTGGVGGAKLVLGLVNAVPPQAVTAIVNTADDFTHLGLNISPDIDTLLYTLAGKANAAQGWGREDESWNCMAALRSLGGPDWFALGDGDLALHLLRSSRLAAGEPLSIITATFARSWDIASTILPMTDEIVATEVDSSEGRLDFQQYFVAQRCRPQVRSLRFVGASQARPGPGVIEAIGRADNRAILIAPSNPFLSIDPILAVPGIREALAAAAAPVIAISPIIAGKAVKGPTAKVMAELGLEIDSAAIAGHYIGLIDGLLIDRGDQPGTLGIAHEQADILMHSLADRVRVAQAALAFADKVAR